MRTWIDGNTLNRSDGRNKLTVKISSIDTIEKTEDQLKISIGDVCFIWNFTHPEHHDWADTVLIALRRRMR